MLWSRAMPTARGIEVEWQFHVADLAGFRRWLVRASFDGWDVAPLGVVHVADVYFDTPDWRLWRTGWALRIRRAAGATEATLKALARTRGGPARRREISTALRDASLGAMLAARTGVGPRVRAAVGDARPRRLFGVRTRRELFAVRRDGRVVAELALDRTRIAAGRCTHRLTRVEIEVKAGPPARVARFVATLRRGRHLTVATRSKFESGLATARLRPPPRG
jgi:inorganic triphosphatase YgiF